MPKNPHAVALGRITSPRKAAAVRANGALGGRPPVYRLTPDGELQKRQGDRWQAVEELDASAKRWLRLHRT